jgi:hypothetical protein
MTVTSSFILSEIIFIGYHFGAYFANLCTFKNVGIEMNTEQKCFVSFEVLTTVTIRVTVF